MENQKKTTQDETTKDAGTTPREQATKIEQEPVNPPKLEENHWNDEDERVILIIGKTGNGKSSMGNTLLGKEKFTVGRGMASTTKETVRSFFCEPPGIKYKLQVIDTPDLSNLEMEDINPDSKVKQWKDMTVSSLFVIVLAVRCDVRYTPEEYATYSEVKKLWRDESEFCNHLVVGFTFGDRLDGDIEQELKGVCGDLMRVLKDAGGRYVVFNNIASDEEKLKQRKTLMQTGEGIMTHSANKETDHGLKQLWKTVVRGIPIFATSKASTQRTTGDRQTEPNETGDTTEPGDGANAQNVQANTSDHGTNQGRLKVAFDSLRIQFRKVFSQFGPATDLGQYVETSSSESEDPYAYTKIDEKMLCDGPSKAGKRSPLSPGSTAKDRNKD